MEGLANTMNREELLGKIVNMLMQGASPEDLATQGVPMELLEQAMMMVQQEMQAAQAEQQATEAPMSGLAGRVTTGGM